MERNLKLLPAWREYSQVKAAVARRRVEVWDIQQVARTAKLAEDFEFPSNVPSGNHSVIESPCFSLSMSFCDIDEQSPSSMRAKKVKASPLQDTIVQLKADVAGLKTSRLSQGQKTQPLFDSKCQVTVDSQEDTFLRTESEGRKGRAILADKSTQVLFRSRTHSDTSESMKCNLASAQRLDFSSHCEAAGGQAAVATEHNAGHPPVISLDGEKQYEYLLEEQSQIRWLQVREKRGRLVTCDCAEKVIENRTPQHSNMFLSTEGISGGFLVSSKPSKSDGRERSVKVRAFGHCIQLSPQLHLFSSVQPIFD